MSANLQTFIRGTAFALIERFWAVDPLTGIGTLTNPTTVVLIIESPDNATTTYTFAIDPEITNPSVGVFLAVLDPQLPVGVYRWRWEGTGAVEAASEGFFEVMESAVLDPAQPKTPVVGPCSPWISGQDVAACAQVDYDGQPWIFDSVAVTAGAALYEISGRMFPGVCQRIVRPCRSGCGCWLSGPSSFGFGPFWWTGTPFGFGGGWQWFNETGDSFGCSPMSKIRLGGYPVRSITQVLIDGVDLPEFDVGTGARNWRLDKWRYLVRMNAPGDPAQPRWWPGCQDLSLDADQPGTFEITYEWGQMVPELGRQAAMEIAQQLYLSCGGANCVLPPGVTRVVRQGIEIERGLLANWMDPSKPTGLVNTDTFLAAYWQGSRGGRRAAVWSPDQQPFARAVGTQFT